MSSSAPSMNIPISLQLRRRRRVLAHIIRIERNDIHFTPTSVDTNCCINCSKPITNYCEWIVDWSGKVLRHSNCFHSHHHQRRRQQRQRRVLALVFHRMRNITTSMPKTSSYESEKACTPTSQPCVVWASRGRRRNTAIRDCSACECFRIHYLELLVLRAIGDCLY